MLNQKPQALFILLTRLFVISCFVPMIYAQQTSTDNSQSKPAALGAITGRVVNESGQPLPGASVYIGAIGSLGRRRATATDNEGNFKIQDLDAGIYRIYLSSPGYVSEPAEPALNNSPTYRPGDSVSLTLIKGGVIAGTVTNGAGEPLVNATVRAFRIRDVEGKQLQTASQSRERLTDDRGYYRIYGLQPGSYVISAGGAGGQYYNFGVNAYANDAPTYAPASTRDTAAEIIVQSGQEIIADIRYRGEAGHSISGRVTGVQPPLPYSSGVRLVDIESQATIGATTAMGDDRTFQLNGVSDGNYEISAIGGGGPSTDLAFSAARRITVKGSDVTGIELTLAPLASITGRVNIEADPKLNCGRHRDTALRETLISVRRDRVQDKTETKSSKDKSDQATEPASLLPTFSEAVPNDKAEINWRNLTSGVYRFEARLPGSGWYVRAIGFGQADQKPSARTVEASIARDGIALKSGDKISGVTITITEGGAGLRGRLSAAEGQQVPQGIHVYLVPAEREAAQNVLRFFEARAESDGTFVVGNITPGRYWIIARPQEENDPTKLKSVRQDSPLRAKILREAESLKKEVSFKPCERTVDYDLQF